MPAGFEQLSVLRITRAMQALQDVRDIPQELMFLKDTALTPAMDGEIMARFIGRVQIADLVTDDAKAGVYSLGKFSTESNQPPNIKVGMSITQAEINQYFAAGMNDDAGMTDMFITKRIDALLLGVRQRMETLLVGMKLDTFSYNKMGVIVNNASWGMPVDLKVTSGTPWAANPATATPIDDMLNIKLIGSTRYGVDYDRITMSTAAFRKMLATAEFQAKAKIQFRSDLAIQTNFSLYNLEQQKSFASAVLGMAIRFYDARYWVPANDGTTSSTPYLPLNKVVIDMTSSDNDPLVQDFANGITTESRISSLLPNTGIGLAAGGLIGQFDRAARGPVAYSTVESMNPPNITMWGVARGFPRKFMLQANAVLDVGAITDPVLVTEPF